MGYVRTGDQTETENVTRETLYEHPESARMTGERPLTTKDEKVTEQVLTGGTTAEAVAGIAGVVLAVIGLATFWSYTMCGIAAIAIGVGLLLHGGAIAARWNQAMHRLDVNGRYDRTELAGGVGTEVIGGAAGIVLGVLAVAGIHGPTLLPVAAIVFGAALLLGGAAQPELENLAPEYEPRFRRMTHQAIEASSGVMVMVGIAAAVLGILALLKVSSVITLSLVAMLCVGGALLLAGGTLAARFVRRFT